MSDEPIRDDHAELLREVHASGKLRNDGTAAAVLACAVREHVLRCVFNDKGEKK